VTGRPNGINHIGASWPALTPDQAERVTANTSLVYWYVNRCQYPAADIEDRTQDGMLGLIRAAQLYDPTRGFTFATYAMFWIRQTTTRGASVANGGNARAAYRTGDTYQPPTSLDEDRNGATLTEFLTDPDPDVETTVLATLELAEVRHLLATIPLTRMERAIAGLLLEPDERSWAQRDTALADRFGYNPESVRRTRTQLQARLRRHRDHLAPA
jgi:RNA polymerase sigma factor (sigma-70 family)